MTPAWRPRPPARWRTTRRRAATRRLGSTAKELLDRLWAKYRDSKGVSTPEDRVDYKRFNDPVYVPAGWTGKMPNGDAINSSSTFLSIRTKYKQDPDWPKMQAFLAGGPAPKMTYHRFWAQSDIAIANAVYGMLFPHDGAAGGKGDAAAQDAPGGKGDAKAGHKKSKGNKGKTKGGK